MTKTTAKAAGSRAARWLSERRRVSRVWLGKECVAVSWLGLLLAIVSPPHGTGFIACWLNAATGIPCPGCGLTRSLSCSIRGMFLESWHYHPLGLVILGLFLFTAVQSLLPKACRHNLAGYMQSRAPAFNALYVVFVVAFVGYGATRALLHLAH